MTVMKINEPHRSSAQLSVQTFSAGDRVMNSIVHVYIWIEHKIYFNEYKEA